MKNIHILPTDKPSRLSKQLDNPLVLYKQFIENRKFGKWSINQHIFITNDEEIKEGDWYLNNGHLLKCTELKIRSSCKKIILTTDQDLIKEGVQSIDDEFLEWFVKNPSCEEVEVEVDLSKHNGEFQTKYGYKIIISKEEQSTKDRILSETPDEVKQRIRDRADLLVNKEETLEEAAEKYPYCYASYGSQRKAFTDGAKWMQERSYSDMQEYATFCIECDRKEMPLLLVQDWYEHYKKE